MQKDKPNLFIIGAAKSGTTSLHYYLSQHPDICMSAVKEPHFFANAKDNDASAYQPPEKGKAYHTKIIKDMDTYLSLFESDQHVIYRGEASPSYFFDSDAAQKMAEFNPGAKIIVLLREPVSRAFSHYNMDFNTGIQPEKDFLKAIENDQLNPDKMWGGAHLYVELGLYYEQLKRYSTYFPAEQLLIIKFEDFSAAPLDAVKKVFEFLKLDINKIDNMELEPKNRAQYLPNKFITKALVIVNHSRVLNYIKSLLPNAIKKALKAYFSNNKAEKNIKTRINNIFFKKDKELLEKHYGISWKDE